MVIIYLIILLLILRVNFLKFKTIFKPNLIVTTLWCVFPALSTTGLYGYNKPRFITHIYILTFLLLFNCVYIIFSKKGTIKKDLVLIDIPKRKLIYVINILALLFMVPIILKALRIIQSTGFWAIREFAFISSEQYLSGIEKFIVSVLVRPLFHCVILITMVNGALGRKDKILMLLSIINVCVTTLCFGGRFDILQLLFYYIITILFINRSFFKKKNLIYTKKKNKRKGSLIFIVLVLSAMITVTIIRGNESFISSLYTYYVGPFVYLDYILGNPELFGLDRLLLGSATLGFISEPICLLLKLLLGLDIDIASYHINIYTQTFHLISPQKYFNALTTILYPFIRDFGYAGIIISTIGLSATVVLIENKLISRPKHFLYYIYFYLMYVLFTSTLNYELLSYIRMPIFIILLLFSVRFCKKRRRE